MQPDNTFDFVVIGSGFGGSVSAMRLTEKGYRVLVLERGKRFRDQDFPKTNWTSSSSYGSRRYAVWDHGIDHTKRRLGATGQRRRRGEPGLCQRADETQRSCSRLPPGAIWRTGKRSWNRTIKPPAGCSASPTNPRLWPADETCARLRTIWGAVLLSPDRGRRVLR